MDYKVQNVDEFRAKQAELASSSAKAGVLNNSGGGLVVTDPRDDERAKSILSTTSSTIGQNVSGSSRNALVVVDTPERARAFAGEATQLGFGQLPWPMEPAKKADDDTPAVAPKKDGAGDSSKPAAGMPGPITSWFLDTWFMSAVFFAWDMLLKIMVVPPDPLPDPKKDAKKDAPKADAKADSKAAATPSQATTKAVAQTATAPTVAPAPKATNGIQQGHVQVKTLDGLVMPPVNATDRPTVTVVTTDQLVMILKNAKPDSFCMVAVDKMDAIASNKDALAAIQAFPGTKMIGNDKPFTLQGLVSAEQALHTPSPAAQNDQLVAQDPNATDDQRKLAKALGDLGLAGGKVAVEDQLGVKQQKDGELSVDDPERFQDEAGKIGMDRAAEGGVDATEAPYFGKVEKLTPLTAAPELKVPVAEQAILAGATEPTPAQQAQLAAVAEYARAQQIADDAISKISQDNSVVLYASTERVSVPALKDVEPWNSMLVNGDKLPTLAEMVREKIESYANTPGNEEFKAKLGQITQIDKGMSEPDRDIQVSQFRNRDEHAEGDEPRYSALVIVDPSRAEGLNLSELPGEVDPRPNNVIVAGFDQTQNFGQQLVDMARSTTQPDAFTRSNLEVATLDGAMADESTTVSLNNDLALMYAGGSRFAHALSLGLSGAVEENEVTQPVVAPATPTIKAQQQLNLFVPDTQAADSWSYTASASSTPAVSYTSTSSSPASPPLVMPDPAPSQSSGPSISSGGGDGGGSGGGD